MKNIQKAAENLEVAELNVVDLDVVAGFGRH